MQQEVGTRQGLQFGTLMLRQHDFSFFAAPALHERLLVVITLA